MNLEPIKRRLTRQIHVGSVPVGGDAPIAVQSMTNTETTDVDATVAQIEKLEAAGADIVRVSAPSLEAAEAFGHIRKRVHVPLVADIHYDYRIALKVIEYGVDCVRINPGNIGSDDRVRSVVSACRDRGVPIRIGVNAGSLGKPLKKYDNEPAPRPWSNRRCTTSSSDRLDQDFKISLKASDIFMTVEAYQALATKLITLSTWVSRRLGACAWDGQVGHWPRHAHHGRHRRYAPRLAADPWKRLRSVLTS